MPSPSPTVATAPARPPGAPRSTTNRPRRCGPRRWPARCSTPPPTTAGCSGRTPPTGHDIVARAGRYGPYVTEVLPEANEVPAKGRAKAARAKPRTASLFKDMDLATLDLDTALKLLSLPRVVGPGPVAGEEITRRTAGTGRT